MRKELLSIIKCPACGNFGDEGFKLVRNITTALEIKEGQLICNLCHEIFEIKNGILSLLYRPGKEVVEEIKGIIEALQESRSQYNDKMLLSLPESAESKNPFDSSYKYSSNFYQMIRELGISGSELILDLGSGNTWSSNKLSQKGCRCVSLDISLPKYKGLESAEMYFQSCQVYYERIVSDMKNLPFVDNVFDIVMSNSSIHHASNLLDVLKESFRVLKKGGKLALINETVCSIFSIKRDKNRQNLPSFVKRFNWNENTYSISQYFRYLKAEGFSNIKVFLPASLETRLSEIRKAKVNFKKITLKYKVAFFVSLFWGGKTEGFIKKLVFWPAIIIFGLPLLLLTKKPDN
ncbi:MAG: methyltransferase domain-containing protein [Candidatus Omnitrophica bacterium]|nr:methyltransferase domain-containing protein [Candidatus Omnitrophota bacterium]MDD5429318.1 methyltransferase domain-containing protein [Candidatus Omnitrophota bacterium]